MFFYYYNEAYNKAAKHSTELVCFGSCNHAKGVHKHTHRKECERKLKRIKKKRTAHNTHQYTLERLRKNIQINQEQTDEIKFSGATKIHDGIELGAQKNRNNNNKKTEVKTKKREPKKENDFRNGIEAITIYSFMKNIFPILPLTFFIQLRFVVVVIFQKRTKKFIFNT